MGQYYHPINVDTLECVYSHDYGSGLKLMEHSWIGNDFVGAVMRLLLPGEKWHKCRLVWCGDYSELKLSDIPSDSEVENLTNELDPDEEIYSLAHDNTIKGIEPLTSQQDFFIINHTQKEYVDLSKIKSDSEGWKIHPLPILTSAGNGNGGGDYNEEGSPELVGSWAGDRISVDFKPPEGYKELEVDFHE